MALPLPGSWANALFEGMQEYNKNKQNSIQNKYNQNRMQQEQAQHQESLALRQQQQERLAREFAQRQALLESGESRRAGEYKHKQLIDPLKLDLLRQQIENMKNQQTPDQKSQAELQKFIQKEEIKKQMKGEEDLSKPTKAVITQNQNIVNSANNIIPQIKQLQSLKIPNQLANISPNQNQKYIAQSNAIADGLMSAFGWPKTDQALHMAKSMVQRGKFESEDAYKKRLNGLIGELEDRRKSAHNVLKSSKVNIKDSQESNSEKIYNPATRSWE